MQKRNRLASCRQAGSISFVRNRLGLFVYQKYHKGIVCTDGGFFMRIKTCYADYGISGYKGSKQTSYYR